LHVSYEPPGKINSHLFQLSKHSLDTCKNTWRCGIEWFSLFRYVNQIGPEMPLGIPFENITKIRLSAAKSNGAHMQKRREASVITVIISIFEVRSSNVLLSSIFCWRYQRSGYTGMPLHSSTWSLHCV